MYADFFTAACRNEANGAIMALVITRGEGVTTKLIHTSYSATAGTAYITFENVFVPNDFVLSETEGLKIILSNFNHERYINTTLSRGSLLNRHLKMGIDDSFHWLAACHCSRMSKVCPYSYLFIRFT